MSKRIYIDSTGKEIDAEKICWPRYLTKKRVAEILGVHINNMHGIKIGVTVKAGRDLYYKTDDVLKYQTDKIEPAKTDYNKLKYELDTCQIVDFLLPTQAAEIMNCSDKHIYKLIKDGEIPDTIKTPGVKSVYFDTHEFVKTVTAKKLYRLMNEKNKLMNSVKITPKSKVENDIIKEHGEKCCVCGITKWLMKPDGTYHRDPVHRDRIRTTWKDVKPTPDPRVDPSLEGKERKIAEKEVNEAIAAKRKSELNNMVHLSVVFPKNLPFDWEKQPEFRAKCKVYCVRCNPEIQQKRNERFMKKVEGDGTEVSVDEFLQGLVEPVEAAPAVEVAQPVTEPDPEIDALIESRMGVSEVPEAFLEHMEPDPTKRAEVARRYQILEEPTKPKGWVREQARLRLQQKENGELE